MTRALAALVAALAVCGTGCAAPAGKSGGGEAVVLRLAVVGYPGSASARVAERFSRQVEALSKGSIQAPVAYWPAEFPPSTPSGQIEASAIRAVRAGEVQLGVVPSEAFQAQGVKTLEALQAPLVVASLAGADRATTGPIAERLQAGLGRIGLSGLGLVPEALERPFGFLKPLETPADFTGAVVRATESEPTYDVLRALGARPADVAAGAVDTAVRSGFAADPEPLATSADRFPADAFTAGNVVLFPKIDVVVASGRTLERLTGAERALLRRAAATARAQTIAATDEPAEAAAYCRAGGTIVTAPASALRALRARVAPVLAVLRHGPGASALVARLARLAGGGRDELEPCSPATAPASAGIAFDRPPWATRDRLLPPNGSYRRVFTSAALRAAGAGEAVASGNNGVATLTFSGNRKLRRIFVSLSWLSPRGRPACRGRAGLVSGKVVIAWNPATPCTMFVAFTWRLDGRDVVLVSLAHSRPTWLRKAYLRTWRHVDCTPSSSAPAALGGGDRARRC